MLFLRENISEVEATCYALTERPLPPHSHLREAQHAAEDRSDLANITDLRIITRLRLLDPPPHAPLRNDLVPLDLLPLLGPPLDRLHNRFLPLPPHLPSFHPFDAFPALAPEVVDLGLR